MKKEYIPAEIDMLIFSTCDVIAMSSELPEPPEGGEGGETPGGGSGVGGDYNPDGWMGI